MINKEKWDNIVYVIRYYKNDSNPLQISNKDFREQMQQQFKYKIKNIG